MLASQRHTDDKVDAALQMGLLSHSAQDSGSRGNLWRIPLQQIRYIRTALYADAASWVTQHHRQAAIASGEMMQVESFSEAGIMIQDAEMEHWPQICQLSHRVILCRMMATRQCKAQSLWAAMIMAALDSSGKPLHRLLLHMMCTSPSRYEA